MSAQATNAMTDSNVLAVHWTDSAGEGERERERERENERGARRNRERSIDRVDVAAKHVSMQKKKEGRKRTTKATVRHIETGDTDTDVHAMSHGTNDRRTCVMTLTDLSQSDNV